MQEDTAAQTHASVRAWERKQEVAGYLHLLPAFSCLQSDPAGQDLILNTNTLSPEFRLLHCPLPVTCPTAEPPQGHRGHDPENMFTTYVVEQVKVKCLKMYTTG